MTWDRRLYFPSKGRRAEDFFRPKSPTTSARFEPVNLGTKGQHATPRPPKPFKNAVCFSKWYLVERRSSHPSNWMCAKVRNFNSWGLCVHKCIKLLQYEEMYRDFWAVKILSYFIILVITSDLSWRLAILANILWHFSICSSQSLALRVLN